GGTTPYTYLCYPRTGAVRTSTNGTFTGVTECRDSVVIHDACGGYFSQIVSCIFGNPTPLSLALTCSNGTLGTATVVATGGTPPYAFRETSSQVNNTTGHFTGLRNNVLFHFDVIDACGRTAFAEISSLNVFQQALECSWGVHLHTKQQRLATNTSGVFVDFSFKPVTYKCLTCVPQITLTDAVGDADNSVYFPTVGDAQLFEIKNGCGEKDTVEIGRASCITSDCNNNLYVLQTNTTIGGTTTVTLKNSAGVVLGTNTTGIFPNTPEGDYIITCHNPNGIPQTITYNYNLKLRIIGKREECDEVKIFYCPVNTSSTFKLYNELTGALVASNSTGVFTGLGHGTDFMVKVYDTHGILVDTISVATPGIKSFVTSTTCTSITASTVLQVVDSQNRPVTYTATNAAGMVVATNTTGSFPGLTAGLYTVTAAHPTCGSTSQLANVGAAAIRCLKPSFKSVGNACKFAWDVLFEQIGRITGGPDNVNISTTAGPGSSTWIRQLRPGSYSFITTCGTYPITLPAPAMPALTYDAYSTCPTNGRITVHGGQTKSNWLGQGLTMSVCADTNDVFQVYNEAGSLKIEEKEVRNASTTFYNLNAGTSYRVYHRIRDALGVLSCPIDTISFSMPFYTRPDLTASFGVVCNGTQGSIALNVINGNPPFTYKLLTGPVTRPDVTNRATSYTFANLPQGAYTFRVSDTCGISADYSTAVGTLSFTPIATRFCNGCVKLEVPTIANASYTWKRGTTSIGTTATTTVCNAAAAATYTVSVSVATCSYSTTIAVAAQVAPLTANAGTDFATLSSTANLAATAAPTGAAGTWTQIAPSSGTTVFSDSHSPSSQITVSVNPGIYTYIWSVQNTAGGCIATDTVKVGIQS
ncbi:MAG: hypothetical protein RI894_1964, partial [Bacteroidota bacterium]